MRSIVLVLLGSIAFTAGAWAATGGEAAATLEGTDAPRLDVV